MKTAALLGAFLARASSHGVLTKPISRSLYMLTNETNGLQFAGECPGGTACQWYTQKTVIPGETTNCDKALRTMGVNCGDENPTDFTCTPGASVPWCAPGSAPVASACGIYSGGLQFGSPGGTNGRDMRDLPPAPLTEVWVAGTDVEVAWAITANHGGGYAYRLCKLPDSDGEDQDPAGSEVLSEECFQSGHLRFSGDTQRIVDPEGNLLSTAPLVSTSNGTTPEGSTWARNPFPMEQGVIEAIPDLPEVYGRGPFNMSVVDSVEVPSELKSGSYVLSWRWDAEQTKQVWSQCGDVVVVANEKAKREYELSAEYGQTAKGGRASTTQMMGSHRAAKKTLQQQQQQRRQQHSVVAAAGQRKEHHAATTAATTPASASAMTAAVLPSGAKHLCTADSLGLDVRDCDAWVALYDAFNGENWPETWRAGCGTNPDSGESLMRTNPCGCNGFWQKSVVCSDKRDLKRITEIYLLGTEVSGSLDGDDDDDANSHTDAGAVGSSGSSSSSSSSNKFLGNFSALVALSLVATNLTGSLPSDLFAQDQLSAVQMVWLDHNPGLGGEIPESLSLLPDGQVTAFELHGSSFQGGLPDDVAWAEIADCTLNGLVFDCPLPEGAETCGAACA